MKGKNCVAIATDTRLGSQALTVACNFDKVFPVTEKTYIGLAGLGSDVSTLKAKFSKCGQAKKLGRGRLHRWLDSYCRGTDAVVSSPSGYRMKIYEMKEERMMEPETFAHLVSSTLYERR